MERRRRRSDISYPAMNVTMSETAPFPSSLFGSILLTFRFLRYKDFPGIDVQQCDARNLDKFPSGSFDVVRFHDFKA